MPLFPHGDEGTPRLRQRQFRASRCISLQRSRTNYGIVIMDIEEWWAKVGPTTRQWLIDHNGEALPPAVTADIAWVGVAVNAGQRWIERSSPSGFLLSDAAVDWIESVSNQENP